MKNKLMTLCLLTCALFYSCGDPLGIEDNVLKRNQLLNLMPMAVGNYWIYENTLNGIPSIDSVIITGAKVMLEMNVFELATYRNGIFREKNYFARKDNKLLMYSLILEPLLDTLQCPCDGGFFPRWTQIADLGAAPETDLPLWSSLDSSDKMLYPARFEKDGEEVVEVVPARNIIKLQAEKGRGQTLENTYGGNWQGGKTSEFNIGGMWIYSIDTTGKPYIKLKTDTYGNSSLGKVDDNSVAIQNFQLNLQFAENIGIVQTSGSTQCVNGQLVHTRKLLRYKLVK